MKCPQCHHANPTGATECTDCGIIFADVKHKKGRDQPLPRAPCAHANCDKPALCKMKTPTGWAAFCEQHYELFIQTRAEQTCQRLGLKTSKQRQEWVKAYLNAAREHLSID